MIGLFDSGFGGLTVLRAVADALPKRRFLYLGDHAAAPYGNRDPEDIDRLTRRSVEILFDRGCRLVVLACNTAAATSLRRLQQEWLPRHYPDRRILGVLVPMVEAITGVPWMADLPARPRREKERLIAVFATRRTVQSNAYPAEIGKRAPEVTVVQQACPELVDLIEAGAVRAELGAAVRRYAAALMERLNGRRPDVVMLGCTHYPLAADLFAEALPPGIDILSQPDLVARSLSAYLTRHPEIDTTAIPAGIQFLTTGDPLRTSALGSQFFGRPVTFTAAEEPAPSQRPIFAAGTAPEW
ncbi:glutamate racemase [Telmatospirillum siberiense]|uniref:Glutamate racemase n=1 Tax=Telmatospirillum siberiense TaxID=382514 RepID=A0A2N3Q0T0_9PROT|nr:glutamate racemase [Telmatospirillum siberiense]PKU26191.1 glutamate racemase [Telmatospirillum siberiense]